MKTARILMIAAAVVFWVGFASADDSRKYSSRATVLGKNAARESAPGTGLAGDKDSRPAYATTSKPWLARPWSARREIRPMPEGMIVSVEKDHSKRAAHGDTLKPATEDITAASANLRQQLDERGTAIQIAPVKW